MPAVITIEGKTLGKKKPLFADWSIPYPPDLREGGDHVTLRDLIARIVRAEVAAFRSRQQQRRLPRVLWPAEIEQGAARGKVDAGGRSLEQEVDEDQAVGTAWQGFEDGLYLVVLDGQEQRHLDGQVFLKPDSRVTFVRLVMLAGA